MENGVEVDCVGLVRVLEGFQRMFSVCFGPLGIEEGGDYVGSY